MHRHLPSPLLVLGVLAIAFDQHVPPMLTRRWFFISKKISLAYKYLRGLA